MNNVNALSRGEGRVCFYSEFNVILCMEKKGLPWHCSSSNPYLCCLSPLHLSQSLFQGSHVITEFFPYQSLNVVAGLMRSKQNS